jgi:choline dehydrogenase
MTPTEFDYVIVGGGTAGCLLANRLSSDRTVRVLLLEAGGSDRHPWVQVPAGYLRCIGNPRLDWCFVTEIEPGLNGRRIRYPRGRVLGGCSSINGMIYVRGQARDYDHWADVTGDPQWSWHAVLPDFIRHEQHHSLDGDARPAEAPAYHGRQGEWRVERQRTHWDLLAAFAEAAVQAGIPMTPDFNRGSNEGVGYFEVNQRAGFRLNAARAFVHPVRSRANLRVWTNTTARRLRLDRTAEGALRCSGIEVLRGDAAVQVRARREVILSAGAIGSAHLLQVSGIGPAELLRRYGVEVALDLPGVGRNLQDHLQLRPVYRVTGVKTLNTLANSLLGRLAIGLQYVLSRSGPLSMAPSQLGAFARSDPTRAHPNVEFHVQPLSLEAFGQPLHRFPAFTASVCNLNPTGRGAVELRSPDIQEPPSIAPRYLSTEEDCNVAVQSLRLARRIVAQPALQAFSPSELKPGASCTSDADLVAQARELGTSIFHPVGTARMGSIDDPDAVVDSRLRVRHVTGLRVVDASVMPTITSGNTSAPTLMIAEKASSWILAGE